MVSILEIIFDRISLDTCLISFIPTDSRVILSDFDDCSNERELILSPKEWNNSKIVTLLYLPYVDAGLFTFFLFGSLSVVETFA